MSIPPPAQIAKPQLERILDALNRGDKPMLAGVPDGFDAVVLADLTRARAKKSEGPALIVFIARDGQRLQVLENAPQFVAPEAGWVPGQMLLLGGIFLVLALLSDGAWALAAGSARDWFARSPKRFERLGATGGVMMIGLGGVLAVTGAKE